MSTTVEAYQPRPGGNVHDLVLSMVPATCGHSVLDAASGDGFISENLLARGCSVVCADVRFSERFALPNRVEADFNAALPFDDASFDGVVSVETIEHLENPWFFMRELARVMKPGAFLVLSTPNVTNLQSRVLMLVEGQLVWFRPAHVDPLGHISPIHAHLFEEMARRAQLTIEEWRHSRARIPKTMRRIPVAGPLLGECHAIRLRKPA